MRGNFIHQEKTRADILNVLLQVHPEVWRSVTQQYGQLNVTTKAIRDLLLPFALINYQFPSFIHSLSLIHSQFIDKRNRNFTVDFGIHILWVSAEDFARNYGIVSRLIKATEKAKKKFVSWMMSQLAIV